MPDHLGAPVSPKQTLQSINTLMSGAVRTISCASIS